MASAETTFEKICAHAREIKLPGSINALLEWDQQTMLPIHGSAYRVEQVTWMAGKIHQMETDSRFGEWLEEVSESSADNADSDVSATVRELRYRFEKKRRLPMDLVQRQAALHSKGQQIWIQARKDDNFSAFAPTLAEIFRLKREEAQANATSDCLYDVLLDDYECGAVTSEVATVLGELKNALVPLIAQAADTDRNAVDLLVRHFPVDQQQAFVRETTAAIGFDYERGRLDVAHHPFCTETGPDDCRITTRYDSEYFSSAFFGCLHEAGHGMYEQGLRKDQYGLPPGTYCSLGIHESQSRLWENLVGRSQGFWTHFFDAAKGYFPEALGDSSAEQMFRAVNQIRPSLIRVEADEATYNLHIIIRFELEQALLEERLDVKDLPTAWNEQYQSCLGVSPDSDVNGVLQDIHWSAGLIGYFPTYSLGNIYASQLFEKAWQDLGDLESMFSKGQFEPLLEWLRDNVHQPGNRLRAGKLIERVTGNPIDPAPLVRHLTARTARLYSDI